MNTMFMLVPVLGVLGLLFAFFQAQKIQKEDSGNERMKEIAHAIAEGAQAFLFAEYKILLFFVCSLFLCIGLGTRSWLSGAAFVFGALLSTLAGYFGMRSATAANVRTAEAARQSGMKKALSIAFSGGSVMGMSVARSGKTVRNEEGVIHCLFRRFCNGNVRSRLRYFRFGTFLLLH